MRKKGKTTRVMPEIETASFLETLFEDLKKKAKQEGLEAEFIREKHLPDRLRADESFLRESFQTLFSLSAKRSREKVISFVVRGSLLDSGGYDLRLSVSEDGDGFSKEQLGLLEEKKDNGQNGELSLLYAIRKGAKERKGAFYVYSVWGSGAVYFMILPCQLVTPAMMEKALEIENGLHNIDEAQMELSGRGTEKTGEKSGWIDRELALNYAGGMEEMRLEMLGIYYEQAQKYLAELPELLEAEDWEKYRIVVHAIKGNSLGIGAEGFSKEAYEQEMAAKNGDFQKIKDGFEEFYGHYQSLIEEVRNSKI